MSATHSIGGIFLDEDRCSHSPSVPSLIGLAFRIRAATLPALVELCILSFGMQNVVINTQTETVYHLSHRIRHLDDDGSIVESATHFPNIFFLMHKWFTTSELLAQHLRMLFEQGKPSGSDYASILTTVATTPSTPSTSSTSSSSMHNVPPTHPTGDTWSRPQSAVLSRKQVLLHTTLYALQNT